MTPYQRQALEELASRTVKRTSRPDLLSKTFPQQRAFIEDPAKQKSAFCTRRAAKSYSGGLYLFKEALENDGVSVLYLALTRDSAKKIMWKDVLKRIDRDFQLKTTFNETSLTATLPNGSVIYLLGCDSSEDDKQKLLGQKYKLCIIDESASFTIDLRDLVYNVLKPACADLGGTICCLGTPGDFIQGLFFDITTGKEPGWTVHTWSALDNPYVSKQWQQQIDEMVAVNPLVKETSGFKQHYLGLWVIDDTKLVYKFDPAKNLYDQMPQRDGYHYILGLDLGYNDETAFVVCAYHQYLPNLWIPYAAKQQHMDFTDVAREVHKLDSIYHFDMQIVDGSNKQGVQEMCNRHGLTLTPAAKQGKFEFQQLLNSDLVMGKILAHREHAAPLVNEWTTLVKDPRDPTKEHPNGKNHCCDAALYAWRWCFNYLTFIEKDVAPVAGSPEFYKAETDRMKSRLLDRQMRRQEQNDPDYMEPPPEWEGDWGV